MIIEPALSESKKPKTTAFLFIIDVLFAEDCTLISFLAIVQVDALNFSFMYFKRFLFFLLPFVSLALK